MYSLYIINVSPPPLVRKRQSPFHAVKLPKNILTATEIPNANKVDALGWSFNPMEWGGWTTDENLIFFLIRIYRECCTKCHSRAFASNTLRPCTKDEIQGLRVRARCLRAPRPYQGEGSVLTYVTETEFRKQRSRSPSCNSLFLVTLSEKDSL